jgi:hypothetical protein
MIILARRPQISSIALCDYLESKQEYPADTLDLLEDFDEYMSEYYEVLA